MRNLRYAALLGIIAFFSGVKAHSQVQTARYISINSNTNAYYEYLPEGYDASQSAKYPLIIFLHGLGELGNGTQGSLSKVLRHGLPRLISQNDFPASFTVNGQTHRFIVLSPQFRHWPSSANINSIINYALANYNVDPDRIYLTGISMGGGTVWEYGGNTNNPAYSKRVAAIVPMCGAAHPLASRANVISSNRVAVWAFHNDKDPTAPVHYTNDMVKLINNNPHVTIPARKTIFNANKHDCWTQAYDPAYSEDGVNVYEWMLGYKRSAPVDDVVLPLNWLDFTAVRRNEDAFLDWRTANEINTAMFIVERSLDGMNFTSVGVVEALGGNATPNQYRYTDAGMTMVGAPVLYYRIKQVDNNGKFTYSKTVAVQVGRNSYPASVTTYPNPFRTTLRVQVPTAGLQNDISSIEVLSLQGSLIFRKEINQQGGQPIILDKLESLAPGVYLLKTTTNKSVHTVRILKE